MVLVGHEDLKAKKVIGFADGKLLVDCDGKTIRYDLYLEPSGALRARPPEPVPIDQEGEPRPTPVAQRWAGCDQA